MADKIFPRSFLQLFTPNPPSSSVREGGETQTRVQKTLSTPQPLNTFSALPLEHKPCRQAPCLKVSPRIRAPMPDTPLGALSFQEADVRLVAMKHDVSRGNGNALTVEPRRTNTTATRRGERKEEGRWTVQPQRGKGQRLFSFVCTSVIGGRQHTIPVFKHLKKNQPPNYYSSFAPADMPIYINRWHCVSILKSSKQQSVQTVCAVSFYRRKGSSMFLYM